MTPRRAFPSLVAPIGLALLLAGCDASEGTGGNGPMMAEMRLESDGGERPLITGSFIRVFVPITGGV